LKFAPLESQKGKKKGGMRSACWIGLSMGKKRKGKNPEPQRFKAFTRSEENLEFASSRIRKKGKKKKKSRT